MIIFEADRVKRLIKLKLKGVKRGKCLKFMTTQNTEFRADSANCKVY